MRKITEEKFIKECKKVHKNYYDYSNLNYVSLGKHVNIICPEHGIFTQRADHHKDGRRCKACSTKSIKNLKNKEIEFALFIKRANKKWNNKYSYDKVKYLNAKSKVIIICQIHGEFLQEPCVHLKCQCLKCSIINTTNKQRGTAESFISRSIKIHGMKYDYSKVKYINGKSKVEIICPEHGSFYQTPGNHRHGKSCPMCMLYSKKEIIIANILKDYHIDFIKEKTFSDCVNVSTGRKLRFDFYLTKFNICIEYDGIQHFKPITFWGGNIDTLLEYKLRDKIKNDYCKINNIKLYRINYKENFIKKLQNIISKLCQFHFR
jgi:hypothetical protein